MDLRSLRSFVAVADTASFSRAAEQMGVVQSAISHQIRALEEEVGTPLFVREGRGVRLSDAGVMLLEDAKRILQLTTRAKDRLTRFVQGESGTLRIGFQSAACRRTIVSESLHILRSRYPTVDLDIAPMLGLSMEKALQNGDVDGGFFYTSGGTDLHVRKLYVDNWLLAMPRTHPLATKPKIRLKDLADEDFIWLPRKVTPVLYDRMLTACSAGGLVPRIVQEAFDEPMVLNLITVGMGIAFVLDSVPQPADGNIVFKKVVDFKVPTELCFVWHAGNTSPLLPKFLAIIDGVAADQSDSSTSQRTRPKPR